MLDELMKENIKERNSRLALLAQILGDLIIALIVSCLVLLVISKVKYFASINQVIRIAIFIQTLWAVFMTGVSIRLKMKPLKIMSLVSLIIVAIVIISYITI